MWSYFLVLFLILFIINTILLEFQLGVQGFPKISASIIPFIYATAFFFIVWIAKGWTMESSLFAISQIFVGYFFYSFYEAGVIAIKKNEDTSR